MDIKISIGISILILSVIYAFFSRNRAMWLLPIIVLNDYAFGFLPANMLNIKGFFDTYDVVLLLLLIFFLLSTNPTKEVDWNRKEVRIFTFFLLFIIVQFILSLIKYHDFIPVFRIFRKYIYYASFILFIGIFSSLTRKEFYSFFKILCLIMVFQSSLYIIKNAFGLDIFYVEDYRSLYYLNTNITRSFLAIPHYLTLAFVFLFYSSKEIFSKSLLILMVMTVIFFSYTRHLIGFFIVFLFLMYFFSHKKVLQKLSYSFGIVSVAILSFFAMSYFFEAQYFHFQNRFIEFQQSGLYEDNLFLRLSTIKESINYILSFDPFFGIGFLGGEAFQYSGSQIRFGSVMGDSAWPNLIVQLGFVGNIILWYFIFKMGLNSFRYLKVVNEEKKWIAIFIFVTFIMYPITSFFSNIFQNPMPFHYFSWAIFIAERYDLWRPDGQENQTLQEGHKTP